MRTKVPSLLPLFRSDMQVRLLALVLLQPERSWTLHELAEAVAAPQSSVHRELARAQAAGVIRRDDTARPHRFAAATDDAAYASLADLLRRAVGIESELRAVLDRPDVAAALIYGSWASGNRRPESDIDVLVVGDGELRELRRLVRPIEKGTGRSIDLTLMRKDEVRRLLTERSSFVRRVMESPVTVLVGDLAEVGAG
jgi:predicted nucleotidyltransferase